MSDATNVKVELGESPADPARKTAVIRDDAANRAWSGEGPTHAEAATEATRKFVSDRRVKEYLPP